MPVLELSHLMLYRVLRFLLHSPIPVLALTYFYLNDVHHIQYLQSEHFDIIQIVVHLTAGPAIFQFQIMRTNI